MKTITLKQIMSFNPCGTYPEERIKKLMGKRKSVTAEDILKAKLDSPEDNFWLAFREELISEINLHKIAIYSAELVLPIFEKEYPNDDRPRKAIKAKKDWLKGKITDEELSQAEAAARAAARAAAGAAARAAVEAAAGAAARAAAEAAAGAAARAAARAAVHKKIIKYALKIIKEEK